MTAELPRIPDELASSPATTKLVWRYLDAAPAGLSRSDLQAKTRISMRSVDNALEHLTDCGLVETVPAPTDPSCHQRYILSR